MGCVLFASFFCGRQTVLDNVVGFDLVLRIVIIIDRFTAFPSLARLLRVGNYQCPRVKIRFTCLVAASQISTKIHYHNGDDVRT